MKKEWERGRVGEREMVKRSKHKHNEKPSNIVNNHRSMNTRKTDP